MIRRLRPTGGHSRVYQDCQDWTIFDDGKPVGHIYEKTSYLHRRNILRSCIISVLSKENIHFIANSVTEVVADASYIIEAVEQGVTLIDRQGLIEILSACSNIFTKAPK